MIQDISPSRLNNSWQKTAPQPDSIMMCFCGEKLLASVTDGEPQFPRYRELAAQGNPPVYLFSVDAEAFFLTETAEAFGGYQPFSIRALRDQCSGKYLYAAFTAFHLHQWYANNRFCGICRGEMQHDDRERALVCKACGHKVYPRINPAVIVGVISRGRILITQYRRGYAHNALVAGFTEIGETLEQTVEREVMEETGVRVHNIRYYKSQPWGIAQDLLMGFYCDADEGSVIRMDPDELKYAEWVRREDIVLQPNNLSLTNEMMRMFREGKINSRL